MDKKRAKEIISSPITISVIHDGLPIYIESVNENDETANIHSIKQPNITKEVPLSSLLEYKLFL
jgi:small acid-soluble spore protein H (minor)